VGEEEPEHPAVVVAIGEAEGDGHGGSSDDMAEDGDAEQTSADGEAAAAATDTSSSSSDDDGGSDGLAIAGVVLGGLGLAAGGTALVRSRNAG
jgi:hypothetical protein